MHVEAATIPVPSAVAAPRCRACGRPKDLGCSSTRDMEDMPDPVCHAALMAFGGGEYTANRREAGDWLRMMEEAVSREPGTGNLVTAPLRAEPGSQRAERLGHLAQAGFVEAAEGSTPQAPSWTLTDRGFGAVVQRDSLWLPR
jgi:hypothetical protein